MTRQYKYDYWTAQSLLSNIRRVLAMPERPKWYQVFMKQIEGQEPIEIVPRCEPDELPNVVKMFADMRSEGPAELIIKRRLDI